MKKIINKIVLLTLLLFTLHSCNNNMQEDITSEELPDLVEESPVVGLWKLSSITAMGQDFINDCKAKDKIEVRKDKTFTFTFHNEDDNCAKQMNSGNWSDNLNNTFKFTVAGDIQTFTLTSDNKLTFSFIQDGTSVVYAFSK